MYTQLAPVHAPPRQPFEAPALGLQGEDLEWMADTYHPPHLLELRHENLRCLLTSASDPSGKTPKANYTYYI